MKMSVSFSTFEDQFRNYGRYDQFGYVGLQLLFNYLEELEESIGEEFDLDVIGLCCQYSVDTYDLSEIEPEDIEGYLAHEDNVVLTEQF